MLVVLTLAVGLVAAVDLRNLQTPRGTALAWTSAVLFGDCTGYEQLSAREQPEARSDVELCRDLRASTEQAREESGQIGFEVVRIEQADREATVEMRIRRGDDVEEVDLPLRRKGDGWGVVLTDEVCEAVGCP